MLKHLLRGKRFSSRSIPPASQKIEGFIVTETQVGLGSCVWVWDPIRHKFWRPIRDMKAETIWRRGQWKIGQFVTITCDDDAKNTTKFPHATEDIFGTINAEAGEPITRSEMHQMMRPFAKDICYGGIDLGLSRTKFAEENDRHASLFIVNTTSPSIIEPDYANTLRFFNDRCGLHGIPVVAAELLYNKKPTEVPAGSLILCSLARGWEGNRLKPFPVKRCYLTVGGIITPPDSALEIEEPPPSTTRVVKLARRGGKVVQGCDVYIGRAINQGGWSLPTSKWHNPFKRLDDSRDAKLAAIAKFEEHLLNSPQLLRDLPELRGKTLGCWCKTHPDVPCHGDVLKHYADL